MFWLAQGREPRMTVYWAARLTPLWVTARHELSWRGGCLAGADRGGGRQIVGT
jgi:hypothetical protein